MVRLTNREAAQVLGVSLRHVARACAARGYARGSDGRYAFPDESYAEPEEHDITIEDVRVPFEVTGEFTRVCFVSDVHVPDHDAFAVNAWIKWLTANKPEVIILGGDILELQSCSGHGGNITDSPRFTSEIEAGNEFLDRVQAACPDATIHYLEGNHETRLHRKVDMHAPTLAGALLLPDLLRLKERGISWLPYGRVFFPGSSKLGFTHGVRHNDHHAKAHLALYGTSIVYGHTHRAQLYTQGFANNRLRGAFGAPCMRSIDVDWIKGPTGWSQGFLLVHLFPDGHFTAYPILMDQQRFVEGGVLYDGRT